MPRTFVIALIACLGSTFTAFTTTVVPADAAQTHKTIKPKKKSGVVTNFNRRRAQTDSVNGYPQPPNPAGMSPYCELMYNIYNRRGVGCNQFGREY